MFGMNRSGTNGGRRSRLPALHLAIILGSALTTQVASQQQRQRQQQQHQQQRQQQQQATVNFLLVLESNDLEISGQVSSIVSDAESNFASGLLKMDLQIAELDREAVDESFEKVCQLFYKGLTMILDFTWTGWDKLRDLARDNGILYLRGDMAISAFVQSFDSMLMYKNGTDTALIFENERALNQSLYYLIGNSIIRMVVIDDLSAKTVKRIGSMRPLPTYYALYASTKNMNDLFKAALEGGLVRRNGLWNLVFMDFNYMNFAYIGKDAPSLNVSVNVLAMRNEVCCNLRNEAPDCTCPQDFNLFEQYFRRFVNLVVDVLKDMQAKSVLPEPTAGQCGSAAASSANNATRDEFERIIIEKTSKKFRYIPEKSMVTYKTIIDIKVLENKELQLNGTYDPEAEPTIQPASNRTITAARRYFRVGTAESIPWAEKVRDPKTQDELKDDNGNFVMKGYCIELIKELAKMMDFDYDLVVPERGDFGKKVDGQWDGLVGDLARGETDLAIASLTMTSEREEVIDFVAPYFEQSGILIVMRKPVRKTSLFKFMTVLRLEVWLSIVGALTLTGIMIWLLDKYSPYSARNNKAMYPYPCRDFTLKESFWFALTSFTPQGGGEAPKALSSRTLVAAYWLFVVLMLATFTANLAAFLTVERMQSPVQSLEQLARQSRINYTVLANSSVYQYFENMKKAEEKLYQVWKEITLNSTSDQVEYRVWDYPIKEQYGHIFQAITQVGLVSSVEEGLQKVIENENAEFAFIHDSAEIKYYVTQNCNLTEVGEVFAEQPYAIAVQQGSHLQEEISRRILDLQKDRYFETLNGIFWNASAKGPCANADDNEGITLESLGGVFIATLVGLALAMVTLAGEVIYYRRRNKTGSGPEAQKKPAKPSGSDKSRGALFTSGSDNLAEKINIQKLAAKLQLKPAPPVTFDEKDFNLSGAKPRISHISVYPRNIPFKE